MIRKIIHTADWHLKKNVRTHAEVVTVFGRFLKQIKADKPDRVAIPGDIFHDKIEISNELSILAQKIIREIADVCQVVITRGNHDLNMKNPSRMDTIRALVDSTRHENIRYYDKSGFYFDDNVVWVVHDHVDGYNPWKIITKRKFPENFHHEEMSAQLEKGETVESLIEKGFTFINLYHDPISGSLLANGEAMESPSYRKLGDFKGQILMLGDIHKFQVFKSTKIKAVYPSSLMVQNFSEGDGQFHGYVMWYIDDPKDIKFEPKKVESDHSYNTVSVNQFTQFDDLDMEIEYPSKTMSVRVVWNTYPSDYVTENIKGVEKHLRSKYPNIKVLKHKKEFLVDTKMDVKSQNDLKLENISTKETQQKVFTEYLDEQGYDSALIKDIIEIDDMISKRLPSNEDENITWKPILAKGTNFRQYKDIDFDFRNHTGITQIGGKNRVGKTTLLSLISYVFYGKIMETEKVQKNGDSRFINNKLDVDFCNGNVVIDVDGEFFGLARETRKKWNRAKTELTGAPSTLKYFKLASPDDEFTDANEVNEDNDNLTEDIKGKTQKILNSIVGSYENYNRLVVTTSDTLNKVLSENKADFIDNMLFDLGFDIFDKKLKEFKEYKKEYEKNNERISLSLENADTQIKNNQDKIKLTEEEINEIRTVKIVKSESRLEKGEEYKDSLLAKLNSVRPDLESLDPVAVRNRINHNEFTGKEKKELYLSNSKRTKSLKDKYDQVRLDLLLEEKESFRNKVQEIKSTIKDKGLETITWENERNKASTEANYKKKEIERVEQEINVLEHSKTCPTCNQLLRPEDIENIGANILTKREGIKPIEKEIETINKKVPEYQGKMDDLAGEIVKLNKDITQLNLDMEKVLEEIGTITIEKNEVQEREKLIMTNQTLRAEMENLKLKIDSDEKLLGEFEGYKSQIEENKKINVKIAEANTLLKGIKEEITELHSTISYKESEINNFKNLIGEWKDKIKRFKDQENVDKLYNLYGTCLHRDGIPTTLLKKYSIPQVNNSLNTLLSSAPFNVWLEEETLSLKMSDIENSDGVIDCLSGSGMERTFSAIAFKFCLNMLNIKSRPSIFVLDEVTGKLIDESVDEFVDLLGLIKKKVENIFIIEHNHDVNPDHYIEVTKDEKGISKINYR